MIFIYRQCASFNPFGRIVHDDFDDYFGIGGRAFGFSFGSSITVASFGVTTGSVKKNPHLFQHTNKFPPLLFRLFPLQFCRLIFLTLLKA